MHQPHHHHHTPHHPAHRTTVRPVTHAHHTAATHSHERPSLQWSAHHYKLWSAVFIGTIAVVSLWVWNFKRTVSSEKFAHEQGSGQELSQFRMQTAGVIDAFKQNMAQFRRLAQQARERTPEVSSTSAQTLTDQQIKELAERVQHEANSTQTSTQEQPNRLQTE